MQKVNNDNTQANAKTQNDTEKDIAVTMLKPDYTKHPPLNAIFAQSFAQNFDLPCLSDYSDGQTLTYAAFAKRIARYHILYKLLDIRPGDKIALLGKNNINWVTVFMSAITYGATIVPILAEFNPKDAQHIVNHSDARLLFVNSNIWDALEPEHLAKIEAAVSIDRLEVLHDPTGKYAASLANLDAEFRKLYSDGFKPEDIKYKDFDDEHTAILNYTSGTTGFSKGVMLPVRSLWGNVTFGIDRNLHFKGSKALSFLPLAHAYGCAFDMLVPLAVGTHITLLGRTPTPRILLQAMAQVRPSLIITVPLILEKIYKKMIVPALSKPTMRWALAIPFLDKAIYPKIRRRLIDAFGGEFKEVIVGGAPLNKEVEQFLYRIKFPFTVGYGMTECGPLISYTPYNEFKPESAGHTLRGLMTAKTIDNNAEGIGELCVKGINVMTGYYKRPDETKKVLDDNLWLHTGDMGFLGGDDNQTIFIRGRNKTMILGASGQNIYPEEIEGKLNNMPFVAESLVVDRNGRLIALVYPDSEAMDRSGMQESELGNIMTENLKALNSLVAPYERVDRIELVADEFQKTPKRSIKRYRYR